MNNSHGRISGLPSTDGHSDQELHRTKPRSLTLELVLAPIKIFWGTRLIGDEIREYLPTFPYKSEGGEEPLGLLKGRKPGGDKKPTFEPTEGELTLVQPFLDSREVPFMEAKKLILEHDGVPEARREQLSSWLREERANNPTPYSGKERA